MEGVAGAVSASRCFLSGGGPLILQFTCAPGADTILDHANKLFGQYASSANCGAFVTLVGVSVIAPRTSRADEPYAVTIQRGVAVKMRDGVTLRADIYRPKADGKFPVLLTRTPYDKTGNLGICMRVAAAGYVCVAQDVRGRYASEGEWYPFKHESEDGYDTIEWLAHQPWSTGVIGMWGGSYVGATQMLAAIAKPPHLAGIFPTVTASDYHENWTYQGGAFEQWFNESWTTGLARDTMDRNLDGVQKPLEWANTLPLGNYPIFKTEGVANPAPYFQDWLAHPNYDDYWKQWSIEADYSRIQVPALHIGAWYDIFLAARCEISGIESRRGNGICAQSAKIDRGNRRPRRQRAKNRRRGFRRERSVRRNRRDAALVRFSFQEHQQWNGKRKARARFHHGHKRVARF